MSGIFKVLTLFVLLLSPMAHAQNYQNYELHMAGNAAVQAISEDLFLTVGKISVGSSTMSPVEDHASGKMYQKIDAVVNLGPFVKRNVTLVFEGVRPGISFSFSDAKVKIHAISLTVDGKQIEPTQSTFVHYHATGGM